MRLEIKTAILLMCAALALSSCNKKPHTPAEDPQPAEVGFTASSQAVWVKADDTPTTSFPYDNFGVWGIARQEGVPSPYVLWANDQLTTVNAPEGTITNHPTNPNPATFTPIQPAYWIKDYKYSFLAVAPFTDLGASPVCTAGNPNADTHTKNVMTFTFDMSGKYSAGDYGFDLLGAAAESDVIPSRYNQPQKLMFWHLLSLININVSFGTDLAGNQIIGEATGYRLENVVSSGTFEVRHKSGNEILTECTPSTAAESKKTISFTVPAVHIIPQNVKTINLYLDFVINKGQSDQATYSDFKISMNVPANDEDYKPNGRYNWNITIGTKNSITFDIDVTPWQNATKEEDGFDPEIDM